MSWDRSLDQSEVKERLIWCYVVYLQVVDINPPYHKLIINYANKWWPKIFSFGVESD